MNLNNVKKLIIGKICWRTWDGLLPAIFFELGKKVTERKGEISLCFDTSPWQLFENGIEIANTKDPREKILSAITKLEGAIVTDFEAQTDESEIKVVFGQFVILASLNDASDSFYIVGANNEEVVYRKSNS